MTTTPIFHVCLGFRDWHVEHLRRCLRSLSVQQHVGSLVLVDTGSSPYKYQHAFALAMRYGARFVDAPRPCWSRAVALNLASAHAPRETTHFVFTDADMIFPREWSEIAFRTVSQHPDVLWLTDSRDLPEGFEDASILDKARLFDQAEPHSRVGQGAAMIVPVEWFRSVRGFDEFFHVWGCEDNDLTQRAEWSGLPVSWLPLVFVAHQWHSRTWPTPEQFAIVQRNRDYFSQRLEACGPIVRNGESWEGAVRS